MVPQGLNNQIIKKVAFEFGQYDFKTTYLRLTDAENTRFSPPADIVNKPPGYNTKFRLDMCGLQVFNKPFGFEFTDDRFGDEVMLSTQGGAFLMMDKYI